MRIFQAFLVIVVTAILWMLPVSQAIYDFRTDIFDEDFTVITAPAETTATVLLFRPLYDGDYTAVEIYSDLGTDDPEATDYDTDTRELEISGLEADATRYLYIEYPYNVLTDFPAINILLNILPFIWILVLVAFPVVALFVIFTGRA